LGQNLVAVVLLVASQYFFGTLAEAKSSPKVSSKYTHYSYVLLDTKFNVAVQIIYNY